VALYLSRTISIHTMLPVSSFHLPDGTCLQSLQKRQPICLPGREGTWHPYLEMPYSLVPDLPHPLGWHAIEMAEPVMISGHWASPQLIVLHCLIETVTFFFSVFSLSDPNINHGLSFEISEPDVQTLVIFGANEVCVVMDLFLNAKGICFRCCWYR